MSSTPAAADVVRRVLACPPTLAGRRLLCIDGPAGSGKTTLAAAVEAATPAATSVRVVHLDDLYPGWDGLTEGVRRAVRDLVEPLARGETGGFRRYDWLAGGEAEWHDVPPVDLLVLEGVGSGAVPAQHIGLLVWVDARPELRRARGLARDAAQSGRAEPDDELRARWQRWSVDEAAHFAGHRTRERADVVVRSGEGQLLTGGRTSE